MCCCLKINSLGGKNLTFSGGGVMAMGVVCFCFLAGLPSILFPIFCDKSGQVLRYSEVAWISSSCWVGKEKKMIFRCRRGSHPSYGDASGLEWPLIRPMRPESLRKENILTQFEYKVLFNVLWWVSYKWHTMKERFINLLFNYFINYFINIFTLHYYIYPSHWYASGLQWLLTLISPMRAKSVRKIKRPLTEIKRKWHVHCTY